MAILSPSVRFGPFELRPSHRELAASGGNVALGGRAFDLLVALVDNRNRVLSKDELMRLVWPNIAVEESNLSVAVASIRRALGDDAQNAKIIRTVAGRGYQFVASVETSADDEAPNEPPSLASPLIAPIAVATSTATQPRIAVVPFTNMSGDQDQAFFAAGITEDIITNLARNRWLSVVSLNTSTAVWSKSGDLWSYAAELGAGYVLEGSVRQLGDRVRVSAHLIDCSNGDHIWADRYDRNLTDVFAVQDDVTSHVASAIKPAVIGAEQAASFRKPPESLDAWAAFQRGNWHHAKMESAENLRAQEYFRRAVALDPRFAPAYAALALSLLDEGWVYGTRPIAETVALALPFARWAIALDPLEASAHDMFAIALINGGDLRSGEEAARRAIELNPHDARPYSTLATALSFSGRYEEGMAAYEAGMQRDSRDTRRWLWLGEYGLTKFFLGRHEEALEAARQVIKFAPNNSLGYRVRTVALAELGRLAEAALALRAADACTDPGFPAYGEVRAMWVRPVEHQRILEAFKKARKERPVPSDAVGDESALGR